MGVAAVTIWSDNLDAIYSSAIAVSASLTPGTGGSAVTIAVIDKTIGIEVQDQSAANLMSIRPAAYVRMSELTSNSLTREDLDDGTLVIDSKSWRIEAHQLRPNPDGELKGECCMFLADEAV